MANCDEEMSDFQLVQEEVNFILPHECFQPQRKPLSIFCAGWTMQVVPISGNCLQFCCHHTNGSYFRLLPAMYSMPQVRKPKKIFHCPHTLSW